MLIFFGLESARFAIGYQALSKKPAGLPPNSDFLSKFLVGHRISPSKLAIYRPAVSLTTLAPTKTAALGRPSMRPRSSKQLWPRNRAMAGFREVRTSAKQQAMSAISRCSGPSRTSRNRNLLKLVLLSFFVVVCFLGAFFFGKGGSPKNGFGLFRF